ncbi:MAG: DUF4405 domain-containing protein [Ignavibacteriae bacterium]|nr:DUF4405 domain-containing protein [Ignavibacteriota bacterium]
MAFTNFNFRKFISFYIAISFIVMLISGIVLFFAPPGRVANWSYWAVFGFTKTQWQSIHTIFTFLFIAAGSFHIYFNWKTLMFYLKSHKKPVPKIRVEFALSVIISFLVLLLTLNNIPPFSNFLEFGEYLKESWENEINSPPVAHAEILTLSEFSKITNIPVKQIKDKLQDSNILISNESLTLNEIAETNKLTPNELYNIIKNEKNEVVGNLQNQKGYGRKTIEEVCSELNINIESALQNLRNKNISADASDKLKNIANENNLLPIDVYNIIVNKKLKM